MHIQRTMYSLHSPQHSTTSLSDDGDDDGSKSNFFAGSNNPPIFSPAQWSTKIRQLPFASALIPHSPMTHLPPEILIHILKLLHSPRDIFSALRVSRAWCECSVELLWHRPNFTAVSTLIKMMKVLSNRNQTFTYAHFIRRLNFLSLANDLIDSMFLRLAQCDRLERLTLVNCSLISSEALTRVLPCLPNLVAIDLTGVGETTDRALVGLAQSAKRLQGINLTGCKRVTDVGVTALANNCPLLRRVKLSNVECITDAPVSLLAKCCPLLLEIDLNNCKLITDVSIRDIWTYSTHMREMRLSHCEELTDAAFPAAPKAETNQGCNPFPTSNNKSIYQLPPLIISRSFEHLRMLDLTGCLLLTDDAVEGIISHAPKIRNLVLSKCVLLTDRSVDNICILGRHIHYLHLGHAAQITDRSVRNLARSCTRLRYIDFANCVNLTDMSVFELSALPKLRRVGLVRVNNLTDEAIRALADRHATLERIHLSYCDQISVMAIHFLLQKLHKLTHLSLTGIPAFRQEELQQFCRQPPSEFNMSQRAAFCVYSGKGVSELRAFLTELFDHITENATDDTEYEDDEYDNYQEDDTPEGAETGNEDDEDPNARQFVPQPNLTMYRGHRPPQAPQSPHEFVFRRERLVQSSAPPLAPTTINPLPIDNRPSPLTATVNLNGATSRLNAQIAAEPGPSRRVRGLPVIEDSNSPPASDVASNRSTGTNQSNGGGFFRTYQEVAAAPSSRSNGALTPDLNYAEIGHGRGPVQNAGRGLPQGSRTHLMEPMSQRMTTSQVTASDNQVPLPVQEQSQELLDASNSYHRNLGRMEGVIWPHREAPSPSPPSSPIRREPHDSVQSALGRTLPGEGREAEARGRSVKRSLRNTLNVAEHYANSLFGRGPTGHEAGHSGSATAGR